MIWTGLDELREGLRQLPAALTGEASHLVEGAANGAAATIKADYPVRTGKLRNSLSVDVKTSGLVASAIVKNTDPIAFIWEHGTQARHNAVGANRGSMPPGNLFIPTVMRKRRQMYAELKDLLVRHGLLATGEP